VNNDVKNLPFYGSQDFGKICGLLDNLERRKNMNAQIRHIGTIQPVMGSAMVRIITTTFLSLLLTLIPIIRATGDESAIHVLYLNSYHHGDTWSDGIEQGMRKRFEASGKTIDVSVEYLDTRRFVLGEQIPALVQAMTAKYDSYPPDVVIVSDNPAFDVATRFRPQLFPDAPIVFCGYNDFHPKVLDKQENITGVVERLNMISAVEMALTVHPRARTLAFMVSTASTSFQRNINIIEQSVIPKLHGRYKIVLLKDLSFAELKQRLADLPHDTLLFLAGTLKNQEKGMRLSIVEQTRMICTASQFPTYTFWDFGLGAGIIGGRFLTGADQGRTAADLTLRILAGEPANAIPIITTSPTSDIFDYTVMQRFNIQPKDLPPDAVILNRQFSLWVAYRWQITGIIMLFILESGLIALLLHIVHGRRIALARLADSESRLRLIVENMPVMMDAIDDTNSIIAWNQECESVTGYSAAEIMGNPHSFEILYPDVEYRTQIIAEIAELGFNFRNKEYTLTCKDGTQKTISWSNISDRFPIPGWYTWAIGVDVTERKQAETRLKDALEDAHLRQKEISALLEASQAIPLCATFEDTAHKIFDICKELIGARSGYVALLSENGKENEVLFLEAGGLPCDVDSELPMPIRGLREVAYRTKDVAYDNDFSSSQWMQYMPTGHVRLENVLFAPLNINEQAIGLMGIANKPGGFTERDAHVAKAFGDLAAIALTYAENKDKLQKNEEFLTSLIESIPNPIFYKDMEGRYLGFNKAFEVFFGKDKEQLIGKSVYDINPRDLADTYYAKDMELYKNGGVQIYESQVKNVSGEIRDVIFHKSGFSDSQGNVIGLIGSILDITEQKRLEAQIRQAQKMEAIGNLAGGIAHDFNNILSPIVGYTEMLLEEIPEDRSLRNSLNEIFTATMRAKNLVKQILTFSRQDSDEIKPMKIQPVIKEALKLIRSTIPTSIEINQDIRNDCGIIKADPTQIHQIIMNLATNAYHAMEDNGGELKVSLKEIELGEFDVLNPDMIPGIYACLTVADTGTGMDKGVTDKIFDPFFTTKEKGKGTGMGLPVVHGIVKNAGGSIHVYSEPGKGTEFHVYLPVVKSNVEQQKNQATESIQGGTERILIVDDEESIARIEQQMLERLGYQVITRTSSIEALEVFRADPEKFDVVITDMAMPNMNGDNLAAELIKIRPDIPILLCTGFSERMGAKKADSIGIKGFLMKPVVKAELAKMVRNILDETKDDNKK
jgi:PAS domain S-box-containing protein